MFVLPPALAALAAYRQFICYVLVPSKTKPGKMDKFPVDWSSGQLVNAHDPAYWTDWESAAIAADALGPAHGVAFVFTATDDFFFVDVDACLIDGQWSPLAVEVCAMFAGAAVEISQSGTGLHVIGRGVCPPHKTKNADGHLELYTKGRFVALTGAQAIGDASTDHTAALQYLVAQYFEPAEAVTPATWTTEPCPEWNGPTDDAVLIERAVYSQSARSAFGNRASFRDLWEGNVDALARAYPDPLRTYDASKADAALAQHLAFWTGKDCERIRTIMFQSRLARDKWERRGHDYLATTILTAVSRQRDVLQDKPKASNGSIPPPPSGPVGTTVQGETFLSQPEQLEHFRGCVYVRDIHRALIPGGYLLKPEQFKVMYGGYSFPMDVANEKVTRNAWEAFTEAQTYRCPRADTVCFRPDLPPAAIIEDGGTVSVNLWWPVATRREPGDPSPFLNHLRKMLPNPDDLAKLLAYIAACVQHTGRKFQWAPLIQGVKGNGKTLIVTAIARAVGLRYSHFPNAKDLGENGTKFTGWLLGKVFIGIEEIYTPDRRDVIDALKPLITNARVEIQAKGQDQFTSDNRANFVTCSNHRDAIPLSDDERRWAIFFCAQQERSDLIRDGMDGTYFPDLYDWFEGRNAYAGHVPGWCIVNEFLHTYDIPDALNPATKAHRAPDTSATAEAIALGLGAIEQEVMESIEQGAPGFANGWISSVAFDKLLARLRADRRIPPRRRREILQRLGYDWHPHLHNGRVNNPVAPDGGKPRLFIRKGSILQNITDANKIADRYQQDQTQSITGPAHFGVDVTVNPALTSRS